MAYARPIRMTASGQAINRPTLLSGITIHATGADANVHLRDGGAAGPILWSGEGDNASSSLGRPFTPPLRFFHKIYVDFDGPANSSCTLEVVEA